MVASGQRHIDFEVPRTVFGSATLIRRDVSNAAKSGSISSAGWSSQTPLLRRRHRSLTGYTLTISKVRRKPIAMANGTRMIVTIHPSALLRIEDEEGRHATC